MRFACVVFGLALLLAVPFRGFRRRRTVIPKGTRPAFRAEGEQSSERSDAVWKGRETGAFPEATVRLSPVCRIRS